MDEVSSANRQMALNKEIPAYFRFTPLLKQLVWGGERLLPFKGLNANLSHIGESWEISCLPGNETCVDGGPYDGWPLGSLVRHLGVALVGVPNLARFGYGFPLMVKFIDTARDLSIQVHPDDETAHKYGLPGGKSEMWYVVKADPGATLLTGFNGPFTPEAYCQAVADGTICDKLQRYEAKAGDCFQIPAGQIHSIGAGILLIEVQQMSNITYRIFDYNRLDKDGCHRQLHVEEAREAIHYEWKKDYRTYYSPRMNERVCLAQEPPYTTSLFEVGKPLDVDYSQHDSFALWVVFEGEGLLSFDDGTETVLKVGETVLLPAITRKVRVVPAKGKLLRFLETYV